MQKYYKVIIVIIAITFAVIGAIIATSELTEVYHKNQVLESTRNTIATFDGDLTNVILVKGEYYSFVLSEDLMRILAHPQSEYVGTQTTPLKTADISVEEMLKRLDMNGSTWIEYEFLNPETGTLEYKTAYLEKYDKYIFGAGYYSP